MAESQAGQGRAALERWGKLLAEAPSDAPWRAVIAEMFVTTADQLGLDGEALLAERPGIDPPAVPDGSDIERFARHG